MRGLRCGWPARRCGPIAEDRRAYPSLSPVHSARRFNKICSRSLPTQILEAGEHTKDLDAHIQPFRYFSHLAPTSKTVTFNIGKPSPTIGGRSIITPSGRCLGGGSSVNCQYFSFSSPRSVVIRRLRHLRCRRHADEFLLQSPCTTAPPRPISTTGRPCTVTRAGTRRTWFLFSRR